MNDQELADRVVALGVGRILAKDSGKGYRFAGQFLTSSQIVRDPRVAMALMEKCAVRGFHVTLGKTGQYKAQDGQRYCSAGRTGLPAHVAYGDESAHTITQACVQALESGQ